MGIVYSWTRSQLNYTSNCSYLSIIVGPCDQTKNEDPKVLRISYDLKPYDNWETIKVLFNISETYE
jgi:hypothetical protein